MKTEAFSCIWLTKIYRLCKLKTKKNPERSIAMKKFMKKMLALALAVGLCLTCFQPMTAKADNLPLSKKGGPWTVAEGVTAYVEDGILYVKGDGEIPDYDFYTLYKRPWDGCIFESAVIDAGITRIGSYALWGYNRLKYVTIPSSIFITDNMSLGSIAPEAHIRITGTKVAETTIGAIPYTSVMSIVRDAQDHPGYMYLIDYSYGWKALLMTTDYPALTNIYYANDEAVFKNRAGYKDAQFYNADKYVSPLKYAPGQAGISVKAKRKVQGYYLYQHLSNFLTIVNPGYTWGTAYSVDAVGANGKAVQQFDSVKTFTFDIPSDLQRAGRTFRVMMLVSNATGEVVTFDDLDVSDKTITFQTDKVGTTYALIYQDAGVAGLPQ